MVKFGIISDTHIDKNFDSKHLKISCETGEGIDELIDEIFILYKIKKED